MQILSALSDKFYKCMYPWSQHPVKTQSIAFTLDIPAISLSSTIPLLGKYSEKTLFQKDT